MFGSDNLIAIATGGPSMPFNAIKRLDELQRARRHEPSSSPMPWVHYRLTTLAPNIAG